MPLHLSQKMLKIQYWPLFVLHAWYKYSDIRTNIYSVIPVPDRDFVFALRDSGTEPELVTFKTPVRTCPGMT